MSTDPTTPGYLPHAGAAPETAAAFAELLDLVRSGDALIADGPRRAGDEVTAVEGYLWLLQLLEVATSIYVSSDPARPQMVALESPTMKWGGDNSDAHYRFAPIDPRRSYRLRGVRGDAAYLSVTVYGGPDDGRWSTRIVSTRNDHQHLTVADDGAFELQLSPDADPNDPGAIRLDPDAVALVTRDYLADPATGAPATWSIECLDGVPPPRLGDAEAARRIRAATTFLRELLAIFPLAPDPATANTVDEPYPVPTATYGWAAGDAAYAMGSFELADGEALVLEGRSPGCVFWNLCLWNPYLQTYDYRYERVTINGAQAELREDGTWQIVGAHRDPGVPNWLSTAGHHRGLLWFRWFLPETTPARPSARVVALDELTASS